MWLTTTTNQKMKGVSQPSFVVSFPSYLIPPSFLISYFSSSLSSLSLFKSSSNPPSSFHSSTFHFYILLLFFSLLIGLPGSAESSSLNRDVASSWKFNAVKNLGAITHRHRVARSPFMHPTATSFKPPVRRSRNKKLDPELRLGELTISIGPPILRSRSGRPRKQGSLDGDRLLFTGMATPARSSTFPRPPVVVQQSTASESGLPPKPEVEKSPLGEEPGMPQNDQHLTSLVRENSSSSSEGRNDQKLKEQSQSPSKPKDPGVVSAANESQHQEIIGFYEVLETINKTTEELQEILRKENIPLDNFLEFIDHGTTRDKVLEFLKLSPGLGKGNNPGERRTSLLNSDSRSKTRYDNESYEADRKKVLIDLPFTEIVHEIPIRRAKPLKDSEGNLSLFKKTKDLNVPNQSQDFYSPNKSYPKKWNKKVRENRAKNYKPKKNKLTEDKHPYLMNSAFASSSNLPAKDSPVVLPFLPPKRKNKPNNKHSASIISMTAEKTTRQVVSNSSPQLLPSRNKVLSSKATISGIPEKDSSELASSSLDNSKERRWMGKSTKHQHLHQSNLRMVFPMKGILMFCGILGAVAAVTILILIIYGAVKCNKKSTIDSYQMSECQSTTVTTS